MVLEHVVKKLTVVGNGI